MKKKKYYNFIIWALLILPAVCLLNLKVTTREARNYHVDSYKIPLFLKAIDFYSRHYHYKLLANKITEGCVSDKEKALKIFYWTHEHIKTDFAKDLPVIDDHVLYIIIRGYGTHDQSADVFTTLCAYAGIPALRVLIHPEGSRAKLAVSLARIDGQWRVFDSYHGNFFLNKKNEIASAADILSDRSILDHGINSPENFRDIKYRQYFDSLGTISDSYLALHAYRQMPVSRIKYELKKIFAFGVN